MSTVSAVFPTRSAAEQALRQLEERGFSDRQISLVMSDETRNSYIQDIHESTKADEGAAAGAGIGGLAGAIAGMVLAAGTIAIPGLNLIVTGALVTSLAGLGAGALTGGLIGGLIGAGIPEHEAKIYENEIRNGNFLVTVHADTAEQEAIAREVFNMNETGRRAA